jgi:lipopolysaccharide transport system permease protein
MSSVAELRTGRQSPAEPQTVIKPSRGWARLRLGEFWAYRELLYFLVWRDVKVRYKQTAFGVAWAVLQPLLLMTVFAVFLGKLARVPSDGVSYPVFVYAGLVPWTLFAQSLGGASESLVQNANLVAKVYFPRLVVPVAAGISFVIDFAISFALLLGLMVITGTEPTAHVAWLPLLVLLAVATSLAVGIWFAALNVRYRDIRYAIPFVVQVWLFSSPVIYPSSLIPGAWRTIYGLNPMVGVVEGFRWALLGTDTKPGPVIALSALATVVVLVGGLFYFQRTERTFADLI